ncbi:MAG: SOS response-associated peptidase family protein [Novosphingobium sp.]|nr:SOS response-associated peptidase family protein [Novosphingobium sp.]
MCNLYRMTRGVDEIAHLFDAQPDHGANLADQIYPGYPGLVIAEGKAQAMNWGFPLVLRGKQGQNLKPKPVTNAREDKLTSPFWRESFQVRRCLVPVSAWAEPEGKKGAMTRTWYTLPGSEPFAVAGLWRPTEQWGDSYTLVMVDGHAQMADVHDRMPLILAREHWETWTSGALAAALELCRTWQGDLDVDRTPERWAGGTTISTQDRLI